MIARTLPHSEPDRSDAIRFVYNESFDDPCVDASVPVAAATQPANRGGTQRSTRTPTDVSHSLSMLCDAPLLDIEQERAMFRRMNYLKYQAANIHRTAPPEMSEDAMIDRVAELLDEAVALRNAIVQSNTRLIVSIAKRLTSDRTVFEDLISDGFSTLLEAVDHFDCDRGFRFSTYATTAVQRSLYRQLNRRQRDRGRISSEPAEDQVEPASRAESPEAAQARWDGVQRGLSRILRDLDPRERSIIRARFGLGKQTKRRSLQSLADEMGICKERVRQLEQRALSKLRTAAEALGMEPLCEPA